MIEVVEGAMIGVEEVETREDGAVEVIVQDSKSRK
jgi:hypothetical protein